jgi:hypothetical protein
VLASFKAGFDLTTAWRKKAHPFCLGGKVLQMKLEHVGEAPLFVSRSILRKRRDDRTKREMSLAVLPCLACAVSKLFFGNAGYFADNLLRKDLIFQSSLDKLRKRG